MAIGRFSEVLAYISSAYIPVHYILSRSDFGFEFAEIFVIENRLSRGFSDSASRLSNV
jgi:hypothetical protein